MRLCVIGTGYVGLVAGACFADTGNHVVCVDLDAEKVARLRRNEIPIYEPGLEEIVSRNQAAGRLQFQTELGTAVSDADVVFIAVGTPQGDDGAADLRYVRAAADTIADHLHGYTVVVNKSTVPVGTAQMVFDRIRARTQADFAVVSNPEFLKEGDAVQDFLKPDRIVIGAEDGRARDVMRRLYDPFQRSGERLIFMDPLSAEMTKYACNAMLATRISFMNEVARLCEAVGADVEQVRRGMGSDPRIGRKFLYPGVGFGGSCFPKDLAALVNTGKQYQVDMEVLRAVIGVNQRQKHRLVERVQEHFGQDLSGKTFAVWGLSFKPETDDMREAPSLTIIEGLLAAGARVRASDPIALENARGLLPAVVTLVSDEYEALQGADALLVVTEWKPYRTPDFGRVAAQLRTPVIFDGRNLYDPRDMKERGFAHYAIGRPATELSGGFLPAQRGG